MIPVFADRYDLVVIFLVPFTIMQCQVHMMMFFCFYLFNFMVIS